MSEPAAARADNEVAVALDRAHGEVYTRRWVVDLILDLVGYTDDKDLGALRLLDPACGSGAFIVAAAERLSSSCRKFGRALSDASTALQAFDLQDRNVRATRASVSRALSTDGWDATESDVLAKSWVQRKDFLLSPDSESFNFVVGNPPYLRLEDVPEERMAAYRRRSRTMIGRADVYIGFYEQGLKRLVIDGRLGFICADRWMRNQYGRALRGHVVSDYSVETVISMHDVDAFLEPVSAYPAITILCRRPQGPATVAETNSRFDAAVAEQFRQWMNTSASVALESPSLRAARMPGWFKDQEAWPAGSPARLATIEAITEKFKPLEETGSGTRVGIGVATGADGVFVTKDEKAVEADRLLPLAMVRDTTRGTINWQGKYLVNPWDDSGMLVDLNDFPQMRAYFLQRRDQLVDRYVARKQPSRWYKTIDKVDANLTSRQKLLLPDMKLTIHPVLDDGKFYPHHNLYFIISDTWDMRVLGGLLLSDIAQAFVEAYAVKMRGGTLRFQAQYLRKIRVPEPEDIGIADQSLLREAFAQRDRTAASQVARRVYGVDDLPR